MSTNNPFQKAEDEYFWLKGQLAAGRITREQFERALQDLMIQDAQGRWWMLGVDSGKWYKNDGQTWVEAQPTAPAALPSVRGKPVEPPRQAQTTVPPKPRVGKWLIIGGAAVVLFCTCLCLLGLASGGFESFIRGLGIGWKEGWAESTSPVPLRQQVITGVTLAEDVTAQLQPMNPTTTFQANSVIHAIVAIKDAPPGTKFQAAWYVTDTGSAATANSLIDKTEVVTDGTRNIHFSLKSATQWLTGTYRIEISVNGELDRTLSFSVK